MCRMQSLESGTLQLQTMMPVNVYSKVQSDAFCQIFIAFSVSLQRVCGLSGGFNNLMKINEKSVFSSFLVVSARLTRDHELV